MLVRLPVRRVARVIAVFLPALVLAFQPVMGATITNTGRVSYDLQGGVPQIRDSNAVTIITLPPATTATVTFHQYAPGFPGAGPVQSDGASCDDGSGTFYPSFPPRTLSGALIDNSVPVDLRSTRVYHAGEAIFLVLTDADRNIDPLTRDTVDVTLTTTTGDREGLRLMETGLNTGVFAGSIQSDAIPPAATQYDCRLSVAENTSVIGSYTDPIFPTDTAADLAWVDPFGFVFDSSNGVPVLGATVTIVDGVTGLPAIVDGDDGVSSFPSSIVTGSTVTDGGGQVYVFPTGGFRFPFVPAGDYRLIITPPAGFTAPSAVPPGGLAGLTDPFGNPYSVGVGSYADLFTVGGGPALNIDLPVDPLAAAATGLVLEKAASRSEVGIGDFVQYALILKNLDTLNPATATTISDFLPAGFRYREGSAHLDGVLVADPAISGDGRTLLFDVGVLAAGASVRLTYVAEVGAGAQTGVALNSAIASAAGGAASNRAKVAVLVRESFFGSCALLVGRVVEGDCGIPADEVAGVPDVRILLEDGTYTSTDLDGQFHFEGVCDGTHVVQLDVQSLPEGLEPVSCIRNTRFAGSAFSQFVDLRGGTLWRTDFHLRRAGSGPNAGAAGASEVGIRLTGERRATTEEITKSSTPATYALTVHFESGSAAIAENPAGPIEGLIGRLEGHRIERLKVIGHSDDREVRPGAPFKDNYELSEARARAVGSELIRGLGLDPSQVEAVGRGPDIPVGDNGTDDGRAQNRRAFATLSEPATSFIVIVNGDDELVFRAEVDGGPVPVGGLSVMLMLPEATSLVSGSATVDGIAATPEIAGSVLTFRVGDVGTDWKRVIELRARPDGTPVIEASDAGGAPGDNADAKGDAVVSCSEGGWTARALAMYSAGGKAGLRTPQAIVKVSCAATVAQEAPITSSVVPASKSASVENPAPVAGSMPSAIADSGRQAAPIEQTAPAGAGQAAAGAPQRPDPRGEIADDATAAGAKNNWLAEATPGVSILFPPEGYNPRSPAIRVVVKHAPGQTVTLLRDGAPVDELNFDGTETSADGKVAVSIWRGVPIDEGDNMLLVQVKEADGEAAATLVRAVHYANTPRRALLVPERSILAADGIVHPMIAVRLLDASGKPVRNAVTGPFAIQPPHVPQQLIDMQQKRQLAGVDRFEPTWMVEGDEGIAWIELQPTTQAGVAVLNFTFDDGTSAIQQELRVWLEPESREWVVVGFAEGTLAYETLSDNMEAAEDAGHEEDLTGDGQVSFYAKGRVKGSWLMTLAYDSDKPELRAGRSSLFQVIDPDEFYTLYGDRTEQRYDASSAENLYLRLERPQFYALFGDYDTGMTESQLTRYSRSFNGLKTEYEGKGVHFKAFASDADTGFVRNEIQGDGTSGLYRLSKSGIVINSEKIRLETRDRFQSQRILETRQLARHIDYDIDYGAGTLFFRQPINARDVALNPIFIVVEYETKDAADTELNAGGRLATDLMDGKIVAGLSVVRDEQNLVTTDLGGADVRVRLSPDTELRVEGSVSESQTAATDLNGGAYLAEIEHHDRRWDGIVWVRRLGEQFGVNQQNAAETGTYKAGGRGRVRLTEKLSLEGEAWHQENLTSDATRDAGTLTTRYEADRGGWDAGGQMSHDEAATGESFQSAQATFGARRNFFDRKLELEGRGELSLGGRNESVDFPTRYLAQVGWNVTPDLKLILAQELTDGDSFDSTTTRLGMLANPWKGARLTSTVNQNINEFGPRTFAQFGLTQSLLLGPRWGMDFGIDHNRTFDESSAPLVIEPDHPIASGGHLGGGTLTEDFTAVTAGGTYRADLWSWNGRLESRQGEVDDRYGAITSFLREATRGVAFAVSAEGFRTLREAGTEGIDLNADASIAWRPLGSRVTVLDRLEFRYEELEGGTGAPGSGLFGFTSLANAGDARSRALVNNFNLNGVSSVWELEDLKGNLFALEQRSQWSIYYGSKYSFDRYDGESYSGYTDMLATEIRFDMTPQLDLGFQGSALHSWEASDFTYSIGPSIGFSHLENSWITIGYNLFGFRDADFDAARYTAQGPWLKMRFKFDQTTRMPRTWSGRAPTETTP